jgi:ankyrin repeat protein
MYKEHCYPYLDYFKGVYKMKGFYKTTTSLVSLLEISNLSCEVLHDAGAISQEMLQPKGVFGNLLIETVVSPAPSQEAAVLNANIKAKNKDRLTPLHAAVISKHFEIARELLEKEANIEVPPLRLAVIADIVRELSLILRIEAQNMDGRNLPDIKELLGLLEMEANPLRFAVINKHFEIARELLEGYIELTPLRLAVIADIVRELSRRLRIEAQNMDGYNLPAIKELLELLEMEANPLRFAVISGKADVARELLEKEANIEVTPLRLAVIADIVGELSCRLRLEAQNMDGYNLLAIKEMLKLLEMEANPLRFADPEKLMLLAN